MYHIIYSAQSQLSNAGSSSLKILNRYISDIDIYEKQQKNYNIISVQPKEYHDTIKMFPKYRLENADQNYYKKMQLEKQLSDKMNINREIIRRGENPEQREKPFVKRGKYLNNVD
jgi:hypothetical protein